QEILQRDRQAVQRTTHPSGAPLEIRRVGRGKRGIGIDLDKGVQLDVVGLDARQVRLDDVARRSGARREQARQSGEGAEGEIGVHARRKYYALMRRRRCAAQESSGAAARRKSRRAPRTAPDVIRALRVRVIEWKAPR